MNETESAFTFTVSNDLKDIHGESAIEPVSHPAIEPTQPPGLRLSRRYLTLSLVAVTLIPFTLAGVVWFAIPSQPEPALPVEITMEPVPWPPDGGSDVQLMPGIRLHNPTDETWRNLSMAINRQYYFYSPDPLPAGGDFRVPLAFFKTSGNKALRPNVVDIDLLTVYAQLPSGRRAICDKHSPQP